MSFYAGYGEASIGNSNYKGNSIVDGLKSGGYGNLSSYSQREKLAEINGIDNYRGTPEQNIDMLNMLKNGNLKVAKYGYVGYSNK